MDKRFTAEDFADLLKDAPQDWLLEEDRHCAVLAAQGLRYRLPMTWPGPGRNEGVENYLTRIPEQVPSQLLLLVQLGAAAIGWVDEGELVAHKAIKKYMKRHQRGKAQIQYLNSKGKSKAGSRLRLANTERFFEEINERILDWKEDWGEPDLILVSCTPNVWGMMFQAEPAPFFDKKDPRIRKIPYDVPIPDFEQLQRYQELLPMAVRVE